MECLPEIAEKETRRGKRGIDPVDPYPPQALPAKDLSEYIWAAPKDSSLPGTESICSGFETDDRAGGDAGWSKRRIQSAVVSWLWQSVSYPFLTVNEGGWVSGPRHKWVFQLRWGYLRVFKDFAFLDSPDDNVVQRTGSIYAGFTRHLFFLAISWGQCQLIYILMDVPLYILAGNEIFSIQK